MSTHVKNSYRWSHTPTAPGYVGSSTTYYSFVPPFKKNGSKLSNHRDLIAKKLNATTAYELNVVTVEATPDYEIYVDYPKGSDNYVSWNGGGISTIFTGSPVYIDGDVGGKLRDQYVKLRNQRNLMKTVAENAIEFRKMTHGMADMTERFLSNSQRRLDYYLRKNKYRPNSWTRQQILADFSNSWLTFSFGISPLMSEAEDYAKAVAALILGDQANQIIAAEEKSHSSYYKERESTLASSATWGFSAYLSKRVEYESSVKYTFGINPSLTGDGIEATTAGIGSQRQAFQSLISTAWELVPYSWVVDYFTTAGSFLDAIASVDEVAGLVYGCKSQKVVSTCQTSVLFVPNSGSSATLMYDQTATAKSVFFKRSPVSTFPMPNLRFKTMSEISGEGNVYKKLANLASCIGGKGRLLSRLIT